MKKFVFSILCLIILSMSCFQEETILENDDLLFVNSLRIRIPSYSYQDDFGTLFEVTGDTSYFSAYPDTLNNVPVLAWDSIGIRIITAAIFLQPIRVEGNQIQNTSDIVWQWHSGNAMEGNEGRVQYNEGRNVINDTINYNNPPDSLAEGHYYWAVWGWGESGTRVLLSSRELEFYVIK